MKRKCSEQSGFTLAELLIVVAIVAVLVAIAIPVFTAQLAKANAATDEANIRSGYGYAQSLAVSSDVVVGDVFVLLDAGTVEKQSAEGALSAKAYTTRGESKNTTGAAEAGTVEIAGQEVSWNVGQTVTYTVIEGKKVIILAGGEGGGDNPGGEGGADKPSTNGVVTIKDSQGNEYEIKPTGDWAALQEQYGSAGAPAGSGKVYSDETGTYVFGWNGQVQGNTSTTSLADLAAAGQTIRIDSSTRLWTKSDRAYAGGPWPDNQGPRKGDLVFWDNSYYLAFEDRNAWTLPPSGYVLMN